MTHRFLFGGSHFLLQNTLSDLIAFYIEHTQNHLLDLIVFYEFEVEVEVEAEDEGEKEFEVCV